MITRATLEETPEFLLQRDAGTVPEKPVRQAITRRRYHTQLCDFCIGFNHLLCRHYIGTGVRRSKLTIDFQVFNLISILLF